MDATVLIAAVSALSAAIVVLWRNSVTSRDAEFATVKAMAAGLTARVTELENRSFQQARDYADDLQRITGKVAEAMTANSLALRDLTIAVTSLAANTKRYEPTDDDTREL